MKNQPSRKALLQRITELEARVQDVQSPTEASLRTEVFGLADIDHAADGICVCHAIEVFPHVRFTFWNRRMVDLTGYQIEEINRNGWYQSVYPKPEIQARARARMAAMREGVDLQAEEWEITRADGKKRTLRISTSVLAPGAGAPRVMAIMHDVSAQRQTEAVLRREQQDLKRKLARQSVSLADADRALKYSDAKYRNLFVNAGDAIIIHDMDGRIIDANQNALKMLGYTKSEISVLTIAALHPPGALEKSKWAFETILREGHVRFETDFINKHGEVIRAEVASSLFEIGGQKVIQGIVRDITERQRIDKELLKMEKLQSLGVMAGGIAHDFNNFLTGIIGNLSLAKLDIQRNDPVARTLEEMEKAAVRAKDLTQQLLTFSKGGEPVKHTACIADLVREAARFALRGSNVRCDLQIDRDLRPSEVDEGQIAQVLHNLMINADQAMPEGGVVKIQGINVSLTPDNPYALAPGDFIQLTIHDQGLGIEPKHLKRVFDPYFTTKQKGSGLGLAVAYSIVAKHDGQLTVDSKLGEGTVFTILLPAVDSPAAAAHHEQNQLPAGSGRILVMDDEDFIRDLAARLLRKIGYTVALAEDGRAAVAIYREAFKTESAFDAVILDLTVPGGMGGKETVRELQVIDPDVRALVSSGYSNDPVMANYLDYGFCGAVKKPYLIQEMVSLLNKVICGW